jgi:hypothetical protein
LHRAAAFIHERRGFHDLLVTPLGHPLFSHRRARRRRRLSMMPVCAIEPSRGERMRSVILVLALAAPCVLGLGVHGACGQAVPMRGSSAHGNSAAAPDPGRADTVTGTVLETMDSGGYTYLKLATPQGERWAAVSLAKVAVGERVTIVNATVMSDFAARSLGRTFDQIIFGNLDEAAPSSPHGGDGAPPAGMPGGAPHAGMEPSPQGAGGAPHLAMQEGGAVAKVAGVDGRTVAEVWAQRRALDGKPVALRARVVKLNRAIMGRNWLHVQDGSGTPDASNFDLVVTTGDDAQVGDVVVVRGVVHLDKDFGAGYAYPVIVEDAKLEK